MALSAVATPCPTVSSAAQSTLVLGGMSALAMWQHQTKIWGSEFESLRARQQCYWWHRVIFGGRFYRVGRRSQVATR